MYENNLRHYRVAKKEIYDDPFEGVYVTKEELKKNFVTTLVIVAGSFLMTLPLIFRKR